MEFSRVTHLKKIGFKKGYIPWNKGRKTGISPMKGKRHTPQSIIKMIEHNPKFWKGKKFSKNHKKNLRKNHPNFNDEKSPNWKGDNVGYISLHQWVKKHLGMPCKCENPKCFYPRKNKRGIIMIKPKKYEWANKSGEYKRDLSDWIQLCPSCNRSDGIKIHPRFKKA